MERYDGSGWHDESLGAASAGALMDAATSGEVSVGVSMYPVVISTDNGKTYATSSSIAGISQSASVFPPESGEQIGIVGSFSTGKGEPFVSGVGHSADLGESWTVSAVPGGSVRYGAFPTSDTWYVTAGMWGEDLANPSSTETSSSIKLSSRVMQEKGMFKLLDGLEGNRTTTSSQSRMEDNGWWGKVFKTTDAGETWENVFSSGVDDHYYFNGISCSSADRCVAVAEGHAVDDFRAYVTTDGGASWTNALTNSVKPDDMVSLMGAGWMSDSEGWVAGASKSGRNLVGLFFKTVDGGETFTLEQVFYQFSAVRLSFAHMLDKDL